MKWGLRRKPIWLYLAPQHHLQVSQWLLRAGGPVWTGMGQASTTPQKEQIGMGTYSLVRLYSPRKALVEMNLILLFCRHLRKLELHMKIWRNRASVLQEQVWWMDGSNYNTICMCVVFLRVQRWSISHCVYFSYSFWRLWYFLKPLGGSFLIKFLWSDLK